MRKHPGRAQQSVEKVSKGKVDYGTWLTKQEAARRMNVSTKEVERRAKRPGVLEKHRWRRPTDRLFVVVYNPKDVAKLGATGQPGPKDGFLEPDLASTALARRPAAGPPVPGVPVAPAVPSSAEWFGLAVAAAQRVVSAARVPPWQTVAQAAAYLNLTETLLRREIKAGRLTCIRDGGYKVRTTVLDRWRAKGE